MLVYRKPPNNSRKHVSNIHDVGDMFFGGTHYGRTVSAPKNECQTDRHPAQLLLSEEAIYGCHNIKHISL